MRGAISYHRKQPGTSGVQRKAPKKGEKNPREFSVGVTHNLFRQHQKTTREIAHNKSSDYREATTQMRTAGRRMHKKCGKENKTLKGEGMEKQQNEDKEWWSTRNGSVMRVNQRRRKGANDPASSFSFFLFVLF